MRVAAWPWLDPSTGTASCCRRRWTTYQASALRALRGGGMSTIPGRVTSSVRQHLKRLNRSSCVHS